MALPTYAEIREHYLDGKWTDRMLKTALTCKQITQAQYENLLSEKAGTKKETK